jgi:pimeloyl-ACP methyl ester carboxylesterase
MKLNFTEIDGLTICYGEKGKRRSDKPSMILIHGFTACKFMWAPLVKVGKLLYMQYNIHMYVL